jgi:hypothetical protein
MVKVKTPMQKKFASVLAVLLLLPQGWLPAAAGQSPLKVFILAGQSNMEGQAVADLEGKDYNQGRGTLNFLLNDPIKAPLLKPFKDDQGQWAVRQDVWVRYKLENGTVKAGPLTLGFTPYGGRHHFGPELQFGWVIGDACENQVLLIKAAWGGKSLYKDFRPPSSGGAVGPYYTRMIADVREALANLKTDFPGYDGRGYELAGFVWYQGWNDGCEPKTAVPEYETNLVNLIHDVRKEFNAPMLPFVVGELTGPWVAAPGQWATLRQAQAAASARPEFKGNVLFVETHDFVRKPEDSPNPGHGHHEFGNAETYFLVGNALGKGMVALLAQQPPPPKSEPTNAGEAAAQKAAADRKLEEQYQALVAKLPPDQQTWERTLQDNLGSFYLPIHKREKVAGKSNAWDFVQDDPRLPRVLLIGDSVSRGYTLAVRKALAGKANVHRAPENCGPTANGLKKIDIWLGDGRWDLIHFNFGIHDRATPIPDYTQRLEQLISRMKKTGAKIVWATTTPIPDDLAKKQTAASIIERNQAAAEVMKRHGVAIDDLFAAITPHVAEMQNANDVHFSGEGYEFLGQQVAKSIEAALK